MCEISEALTHSDTKITETYVDITKIVELSIYEKHKRRLNEELNK